ncbi:beta-ketoacyl synthase N-terminal-like domain-containing protein [Pseudonocardia sp. HH130630-07]|uniref:beta-ketoacyl synthase N-terminal-like domain-containing protein n=1 Tax=Pseudonocardia sp. HH130630-07 TaxID=1690815 RepID=UPI0008153EE8|nr:beta-ketoacyl synthase N-terminal-like domain-containing protein [Pseudonocardia sp. HH130630-07]ANY07821.1 hypothetical protein AFB00_17670 [Pseudonocardia sp. HH130630-07]
MTADRGAGDEVVVTGMAWTTPLGSDLDDVWRRLLRGEHGFVRSELSVEVRNDAAALVTEVDPALPPGERLHRIAVPAVRRALGDAGLDGADPRAAFVLATSYGDHLDSGDTTSLSGWAGAVTAAVGHPHEPVSVATACSAGSDALVVGAALVRSGRYPVVVCVGADVVTDVKRLGHSGLGTMSRDALRAFDTGRSGMLLGEGAGVVVLESAGSARDRAARRYAVLRGTGSANDASGMTAPDPSGRSVHRAVERCLDDAGLTPAAVSVVSAHGTGTALNDQVEAASLGALFGGVADPPPVFGTKGALGHSLGACGVIEAISVVLALASGRVPPVRGLREPLPDVRGLVPVAARSVNGTGTGSAGLSLTLGFGGFNTALALSV